MKRLLLRRVSIRRADRAGAADRISVNGFNHCGINPQAGCIVCRDEVNSTLEEGFMRYLDGTIEERFGIMIARGGGGSGGSGGGGNVGSCVSHAGAAIALGGALASMNPFGIAAGVAAVAGTGMNCTAGYGNGGYSGGLGGFGVP
ncbi:MAG: hypothetical protein IPL47_11715 [Phyllobacteriaceae bacterium]|nr:hypothetical protein [Phyllobacteriaceae bacterium]